MRPHLLFIFATVLALASACAETVRCPDGQVFDDAGSCTAIPDGGAGDAGMSDAGAHDGG